MGTTLKPAIVQRHETFMRLALKAARRGFGTTSPNPMVGAVLVRNDEILAVGYHRRAGGPHAEIEVIQAAQACGLPLRKAILYVTLEPCCTAGRTPPCTEAIIKAGLRTVVVGAIDPNRRHCGQGFSCLRKAGIDVVTGVLESECTALNEAFNHWIVHRTPLVTVKAAMTLDGKIATRTGESKWITGRKTRLWAMKLRQGADAVLVGVNTILADDPSLTLRGFRAFKAKPDPLRRIILDSRARTPVSSKVVSDANATQTTIYVGPFASAQRVKMLSGFVRVVTAPLSADSNPTSAQARRKSPQLDLNWILGRLGSENVTSLLVEGGGEVNASFLDGRFAQKIAFFYAPKILGGALSRKAVAGAGAGRLADVLKLGNLRWRLLGQDWLLTGNV